jgi:hypothetical protein
MRWLHNPPPCKGDIRTIKKFLWLPTRFGNETRWLEFAMIEQSYEYFIHYHLVFGLVSCVGWRSRGWADQSRAQAS